jgi:phosphoribosyl 1,2-cyclic phosphodiesterase
MHRIDAESGGPVRVRKRLEAEAEAEAGTGAADYHGAGGGTHGGAGNTGPAGGTVVEVLPVPVLHGSLPILGFRVGSFAYLTDCSGIPEASYGLLEGVQVVVIDALRFRSHPTHFNVDQSVEAVRRIGAEKAYLTHLCHDVSYRELAAALPEGIYPAYDGLELTVPS